MDAVWLPVLWRGESLNTAMDIMKQMGRDGTLVETEDGYDVVLMQHAGAARERGRRTLGDVQDRARVHLPQLEELMALRLDFAQPLRTAPAYEVLMDRAGTSYALIAAAYDMGLIVTRHEGGRQALAPGNTYYCQGGPKSPHTFPRPDVKVGDTCIKCVGTPKGTIYQK